MNRPITPILERIHANSRPDGECLIWAGYVDKKGVPRGKYFHKGKWRDTPIRRAYCLENGIYLTTKHHVTTTCGNSACVAPDHIRVITGSKHLKENLPKIHAGAANMLRASKIAAAHRARTKTGLTIESVRRIRAEDMTPEQVMAEFNISRELSNRILAGKCWRDFTNPFMQLFHA